jgi:hypothetical protein
MRSQDLLGVWASLDLCGAGLTAEPLATHNALFAEALKYAFDRTEGKTPSVGMLNAALLFTSFDKSF